MSRDPHTDLDDRIAAAWPITVADAAPGPTSELLAAIEQRIAAADRADDAPGRRREAGPGRRTRSRGWATTVVAAALLIGALVVGGVVARRLLPIDPLVVAPVDDEQGDGAGAIDDPRALLDTAGERTRGALGDAGQRWSMEMWRITRPTGVDHLSREQLGAPHLARYRTLDRDGDWSAPPATDSGAAPLAMRYVDRRWYVRTGTAGGWSEISDPEVVGLGAEGGRDGGRDQALLDAVAKLHFVEAAPSRGAAIRIISAKRAFHGPLAEALGILPFGVDRGGVRPRALLADIRIDPVSGRMTEVALWDGGTVTRRPGGAIDVVSRTAIAFRYGADAPDITAPDATRVASWRHFCAADGHDEERCWSSAFVRPTLDPLEQVEPVDP